MKRTFLFSQPFTWALVALLTCSLVSCDTTPRERKEVANRELDKAGQKAEELARQSKEEAKSMGKAYSKRKAEDRARRARGTVSAKQQQMEQDLLGEYRYLSQTTPENLKDAYVHFLQQVRDRKDVWTMEDWDYVDAIYKRLNEREKVLHDDIILRHAAKIKALQTEYLTLENKADVQDFRRIKKEQENR